MSSDAAREAVRLLDAAGNGRPDAIAAAEQLAEILDLASVELTITGARIVGRGGSASADVFLSDGSALTFERLRDAGKPNVLAIEVAACTGATPKLNGGQALRAVALLRAVAEHEAVFSADQIAADWGSTFLQAAPTIDVDMSDQGERWGAFSTLAAIDPAERRGSGEAPSVAAAATVLVHTDGTRLVRCGWFRAHVRGEDAIGPTEIANRMQRVGWTRRGGTGRVKASHPHQPVSLAWSFYTVPAGWEATLDEPPAGAPR